MLMQQIIIEEKEIEQISYWIIQELTIITLEMRGWGSL